MSTQRSSPKWLDQLRSVRRQFRAFKNRKEDDDEYSEENFIRILQRACDVVRGADASDTPDLKAIVEYAHELINEAIIYAYNEGDLFFMPSYAHSEASPVVEDSLKIIFGPALLDSFKAFLVGIAKRNPDSALIPREPIPELESPKPWITAVKPHPNTTRLSRFREGVTASATDAMPLAQLIYQARCEVTDDRICTPVKVAVSSGSNCLAVIACGGWKNRDPVLHYYTLDGDDTNEYLTEGCTMEPGLSEVAYQLALDESRKLMFMADSARIKSFSWDPKSAGQPVHTLRCDQYEGPIAVLPNGRIVRAGNGVAASWNISKLETHGPKNKRIGSGKFSTDDIWRDHDNDEIELSTGSKPHATIKFASSKFRPVVWHLHGPSGNMLCSESGRENNNYSCSAVDLEHNGRIVTRYLGHGGDVQKFSTSEGDPNTFATAGSDGYARLFDVRHPLPVATFNPGRKDEFCVDVVSIHPDGIPTLFTAGQDSQQIKMWDVRARAAVYELATGNNAVNAMAWDSRHSTLYAATECGNMDRLGSTFDYRKAKIPNWAKMLYDRDADPQDVDDEEEEDEDDWEEECWPKNAYHGEDFYGYAFDAGEHRLYGYAMDGKVLLRPFRFPRLCIQSRRRSGTSVCIRRCACQHKTILYLCAAYMFSSSFSTDTGGRVLMRKQHQQPIMVIENSLPLKTQTTACLARLYNPFHG
ncbi:hypothetical protein A0H81_09812 [Grifola frondosa]|uniref:Uncharacterized protein n=1 Tax=Grifola frondosa TaxID=5627 RepID=A0A1C7LZI1_GRIFR|nr:hypothetical protein A0H81_09812 [Grifola frondosa]